MTKLFQAIESVYVTVNHKGFQFQFSYDNASGIYNMVVLDAVQYVGNVFVTLAELKEAGNFSKFAEAIVDDQRNDNSFTLVNDEGVFVIFPENEPDEATQTYTGFTWEEALAKQQTLDYKTTITYDINL
ncbi:hypothetical protein MA9V2_110 [Chryseobacterium phage MA9V-2]|nr:hypothetical protein MA9V2_110 [Chryseobacterium phage MA9V-2]